MDKYFIHKIKYMNIKRINYMLEQREFMDNHELKMDLKEDTYKMVVKAAEDYHIKVEDLIYCLSLEFVLEKAKDKVVNMDGKTIIDIYDMYKIEELLKTGKTYIVITHEQPFILLPHTEYENISNRIEL